MNQPLVSIGVALYNDEKHVRRTLDCILAQGYQNLEILVSDDCSADGTAEICREYQQKDSRIRFMSQRRNLGSLANHELLFNLSSGEYFMWCNGHDCFDPNYVESCVKELESDPELVLCYSKTVRHDYYDKEQTELFDALDTRGLDPLQRFQAVFSAVVRNACMFYGLFRAEVLRKSKRHRRTIGGDLIFINEIGLLGHVLQLPGTTFHRYAMRPPSANDNGTERWMDVIVQPRGHKLETITPWLNMGYEYLTMIADSGLPAEQQGVLLPVAVQMLNHVFGGLFRAETERLLQVDPAGIADPVGRNFYLTEIIHNLNRARFFHPDTESIDRVSQRYLELARQADQRQQSPKEPSMTTVNASPSGAGWPPDAPIMFHVIEAIRSLRQTCATARILALETGTIRSYGEKHESTRHISAALGSQGHLISVDCNPESIRISRDICKDAPNVTWVESESIPFLKGSPDLRLSFALLDSANDQQLIMDEFTLVAPMMLTGGTLMIDDAGVRTDKTGFDSSEAEKGRAVWRFLESCGARYTVLETPHGHGTQIKIPFDEENGRLINCALRGAAAPGRSADAPSAALPQAAPARSVTAAGDPGQSGAEGEVLLSFVIIVLNGMPFLEYCINALYDIAHEIIVVEGAVENCRFAANPDGSSLDGTVEYLRNHPDPQGKLRLIQGLWPEKVHMQNAALEQVTGNYVWLVDSDEIYKREDLATIKSLLAQTPSITQVNFIPDNFWKGFDTIFVSPLFFDTGCHYRRLFKYVPGAVFTTHRPPTLVWPGEERSTEQMHLIGGKVTRAMGIIIYHYSYVLDSQVRQKIELYNRYGWGEGWRIDLNEWYRECFLKWTPDNARDIESRYPVWTGDRNSRTLPFTGTHPRDMQEYIDRSKASTAKGARPKGRFKVAGDYQEDQDLTKVGTDSDFAGSIEETFRKHRPKKIIETGTYHGEGTTRVITSTLKSLGIDATFFSIECNPQNHAIARENLRRSGLLPFVKLLNGISTPRAFLPSYEEIEQKYVRDLDQLDFDDVFIDHQEHQRALFYYKETDFSGVPEDLLGASLAEFGDRPDFVLLDSGGHMGYVEFNYLIQKLKGPCFVALDDIYHIKHHESFLQMQKDPRFKIVVSSREKFGFCIAYFTPQNVNRILWLRTDSIGDNVLAGSMLPHVKARYPEASITVVCQEHIAELYEACPLVDGIITFDLRKACESGEYRSLIIGRLREAKADLLLNSLYSRVPLYDLFALESGAPIKIALYGDTSNIDAEVRRENNRRYTRLLSSAGDLKPELERHRDFLRGLGIEAPQLGPVFWTSEADERFADDFFRGQGLDPKRCIALFAGAQSGLRTYDHYGKALSGVCAEGGYTLLALGSAADQELNQLNLAEARAPGVNLSGKLTLRQTAAILRRCRLAVGAETGTAHIACAVGTPNVVLLGGGHFGRFMPYSPLTSAACLPLACHFCNWNCKFQRPHCVKDLHPSVLEEAIRQTLAAGSEKVRLFVESPALWHPLPGEPAWKWRPELLGDYPHQVIEVGAPAPAPRRAGARAGACPRISIVVPSYNYGRYLEACLDSILSQDYPNLELIVMDGGSTDNTVEILKKYQDRLAYWRSAPDGGQYSAIEEGLNRSTGDILGWLNADDMFHPGVFDIVSRIFTEHPEVEWLMGRPNSFDEGGKQKHVLSFLPMNSRAKYLEDQELIQQEGTFWRRELWQRSGAYIAKNLPLAADLELWARFFRSARLYSVELLIAGFRDHPLQKSKDKAGYTAEADRVLARERELFEAEANPFNPPAPLPILIEGDRVIM